MQRPDCLAEPKMPVQAVGKHESAEATKGSAYDGEKATKGSAYDGEKAKASRTGKRKRKNKIDTRHQEDLSTAADEPLKSTPGKKRKKTEATETFSRENPTQERASQDCEVGEKKRPAKARSVDSGVTPGEKCITNKGGESCAKKSVSSGKKGGAIVQFLKSLSEMLEDPANAAIIGWEDEGTTIRIYDSAKLAAEVFPKYFNHNNIPSFVRQLNLYHFKKVLEGPNILKFQHPEFKKGHPELLRNIVRQKKKRGKKANNSISAACLAQQRQELDTLLKGVSEMSKTQKELLEKVKSLQEENCALKAFNIDLQKKQKATTLEQAELRGRLKQTFHFMFQLWEELNGRGGRLAVEQTPGSARKVSFTKLEARPPVSFLEDSPSTGSSSARPLGSSHRLTSVPLALPAVMPAEGAGSSHGVGIRRLTSREAALFSNPGTSKAQSFDEMAPILADLGLAEESDAAQNMNKGMLPPKKLDKNTRSQSFVSLEAEVEKQHLDLASHQDQLASQQHVSDILPPTLFNKSAMMSPILHSFYLH